MFTDRRWLLGGAAALLAAVVGVALVVRSGDPACAAAAQASGKATFYDSQGGGGNCSFVSAPANRLYVALGPSEYAKAANCGGYLDVTGPKGKVRVLIMDQCPECAPGHIDLSKEAFAKIGNPVDGIIPVTYKQVVNPALPGPLTFRIKEGASQYWFAVLVGNHGNPLKSVEVKQGSAWRKTARADFNYWIFESGLGPGPYTIRVTDVHGQSATASGIKMAPTQTQKTAVTMYGKAAPPPAAAQPATSPTRRAAPSPSGTSAAPPPATSAPAPSPPESSPSAPGAPDLEAAAVASHC
ncbi:expansin EXLX1 family cellulose-binding protein [Phytohabitans rumicis]|uniref:expansin EXLX1 family cellulose-binding protein n=1 Tax=Phytohabitans rumicis TaxID=1076125 RepID=UPI001FE447CD|nr:expansin EXLX1 family cellulose-binding protein [Phytohabitans rumicis]